MKGGKVKNLPLEIGKGMGFNEAALHEGRKTGKSPILKASHILLQ